MRPDAPLHALVSVHDLMPETLPAVRRILDLLDRRGIGPVTLLVVPGRDWSAADLDLLRQLQDAGHVLAGHGWSHRVRRIAGPAHLLHSLLISRRAAEHLALGTEDLRRLVARCHAWFEVRGLNPPTLYVPPAWALGRLDRDALAALPFRQYETTGGVLDAYGGRFRRLPLAGFEADRRWRAGALRLWNAVNTARADAARPLRVAIHPRDLELRLGGALDALLARDLRCHHYGDLLDAPGPEPSPSGAH